MTHPSREEWMAYLYGELEAPKQAELDDHLRHCDQCKNSITQWRTVMTKLDIWQLPQDQRLPRILSHRVPKLIRWAVAAVLIMAAGYMAGEISVRRSLDVDQLRTVSEQMREEWTLALASHNIRFQKELDEFKEQINYQRNADLTEFAARMLSVSGAVTNQLLRELIYEIQTTQMQDRHRFAAALEQIESNRLRDSNWARNSLKNLALCTEDVLLRTGHDVPEWLSDPNTTHPDPDAREDRNISERKE